MKRLTLATVALMTLASAAGCGSSDTADKPAAKSTATGSADTSATPTSTPSGEGLEKTRFATFFLAFIKSTPASAPSATVHDMATANKLFGFDKDGAPMRFVEYTLSTDKKQVADSCLQGKDDDLWMRETNKNDTLTFALGDGTCKSDPARSKVELQLDKAHPSGLLTKGEKLMPGITDALRQPAPK